MHAPKRSVLVIAAALVVGCFQPAGADPQPATADDDGGESSETDAEPGDTDAEPDSDETDPSSSDGGESGGEPEPCDPGATPFEDVCVLDDGLGVFVATWGDDAGPGTKDEPLATLGAAVQRAATGSRRVYACAEDFTGDTLVVASNVALFGGLDCENEWTWIGDTRRTRYATPSVALQITGAVDVTVEDFELASADATTAGASSIAVVVHGAKRALFRRSEIAAGIASAGSDASAVAEAAAAGTDGEPGLHSDCVPVDTDMFGLGAQNAACNETAGGNGGGLQTYGDVGLPASFGGEGGEINTYAGACTPGGDGLDGTAGIDGEPAHGLGSLDVGGWIAPTASAGVTGAVGGGGGGGAGGLPPAFTCSVSDVDIDFDILAPGGGGGGAGGCGGAGGAPGGSGGSSIAIVSVDASVVLESTTLHSADGGDGGDGAAGQLGGSGGLGGIGGDPIDPGPYGGGGVGNGTCASAGGGGGTGGRGGMGGGGAGGHALGVAYRGTAPVLGFGVAFTMGSAGTGGGVVHGDDGVAAETLAIE